MHVQLLSLIMEVCICCKEEYMIMLSKENECSFLMLKWCYTSFNVVVPVLLQYQVFVYMWVSACGRFIPVSTLQWLDDSKLYICWSWVLYGAYTTSAWCNLHQEKYLPGIILCITQWERLQIADKPMDHIIKLFAICVISCHVKMLMYCAWLKS